MTQTMTWKELHAIITEAELKEINTRNSISTARLRPGYLSLTFWKSNQSALLLEAINKLLDLNLIEEEYNNDTRHSYYITKTQHMELQTLTRYYEYTDFSNFAIKEVLEAMKDEMPYINGHTESN